MSKQTFDKKDPRLETNRIAKKAVVLGTGKKTRLPLIALVLGCTVAVAVAGFNLFRWLRAEPASVVIAPTDKVSYPTESFQDGKARYYQLDTGDGKAIKFFILKSSDGVIRAAFDACDVCYKAGQGYDQQEDFMVCRNCGQRFSSAKVNELRGGCNPAPLNRVVEGGQVVITVKDILEGRPYFDFQARRRI